MVRTGDEGVARLTSDACLVALPVAEEVARHLHAGRTRVALLYLHGHHGATLRRQLSRAEAHGRPALAVPAPTRTGRRAGHKVAAKSPPVVRSNCGCDRRNHRQLRFSVKIKRYRLQFLYERLFKEA